MGLVAQLTTGLMADPEGLVEAWRTDDRTEAVLLRSVLEQHGIDVVLFDDLPLEHLTE
jgi:hypothetical protein